MKSEYLITIKEFCLRHEIEESFVISLADYQLINTRTIEEDSYIHFEELPKLEKMIRLHHELGINLEGIEAIDHLLKRVEQMQQEMDKLRRKLDKYEDL